MIPFEKYLEAKKIVDAYNLENRKSVGRPSFKKLTDIEKKSLLDYAFSKDKFLNSKMLKIKIMDKINVGDTFAKSIIKKLKEEGFLKQTITPRGDYYI